MPPSLLGASWLLYFIVTQPVIAEVIGKHIVYVSPHFYQIPVMVLYLAATGITGFFSNHGFVSCLACWHF